MPPPSKRLGRRARVPEVMSSSPSRIAQPVVVPRSRARMVGPRAAVAVTGGASAPLAPPAVLGRVETAMMVSEPG